MTNTTTEKTELIVQLPENPIAIFTDGQIRHVTAE